MKNYSKFYDSGVAIYKLKHCGLTISSSLHAIVSVARSGSKYVVMIVILRMLT